MREEYDHRQVEADWQGRWARERTYDVDVARARTPYYNLMMFPYPSAEGLHVGNVFAFIGSDIHGRFMRARGYDVFEPMGFDAFGIHSENYALKVGTHPATLIPNNVLRFRAQLQRLGAMFDWAHEENTTDPGYYRWTQWIFLQLFKAGLAYQQEAPVNWCPACQTVLSDEMAEGGVCERCDTPVETRLLRQWFFRITAYADRLLEHLEWIDWSPVTKQIQRRWIGREEAEDGTISYRLHDWCISRQRYWGTPIPIVHCARCGVQPVPEEALPVVLPAIADWAPDGSGRSPLARDAAFVNTTCPACGGPARRETDVSDNFLDSAWYFLRYPSAHRQDVPFDPALTRKWLPVDMYIGGNEHAVLHLMYTRFITMVLHDLGHLPFDEPFTRFRAHGILVKDGAKMSKSKGNVINPDAYIAQYGSDAFRTYLMFMGAYQEGGDFRDAGISGVRRFLERVWRYVTETTFSPAPVEDPVLRLLLHVKIKKVTEDIAALNYNTAIAAIMELLNGLQAHPTHHREAAQVLLQLLGPFAPCITHALWERLGGRQMLGDLPWPHYDELTVRLGTVEIAIQVNGKVRARCTVPLDTPQAEVEARALHLPEVAKWLADKTVRRLIYVPNRLLNILVTE